MNCADQRLEAIAGALERVSSSLDANDETIELEEALARLFGALFECSECCFGGAEAALASIEAARIAFNRNGRWLRADQASNLGEAINGLVAIINDGTHRAKAAALVDLLKDRMVRRGESWAVLGRSARISTALGAGLKEYGLAPVVTTVGSMTSDREYDGIALAGWPNDSRFRRLLELEVAPDVRILTYQFEKKWFDRFRAKARQAGCDTLSGEQRAAILQVPYSRLNGEAHHDPFAGEDAPPVSALESPVFEFEARIARRHSSLSVPLGDAVHELRPARFVRFAGGRHAFLTEWAELPVLNEVIERAESGGARMGRKTVEKFIPGDFLLFRAAGDKEFIRVIAEEMMGSDEYGRTRAVAERWKAALRRLGSSPALVQRRLTDFGLTRTSVTVGSWLGDPNKIGPGEDDDIAVIAKAAGDAELTTSFHEVVEAISTIRSAHLSAGLQLTRLILQELRGRIRDIRQEPTLLDLGYGQAWVVQVESVETEVVSCSAKKTNRLLSDGDTDF